MTQARTLYRKIVDAHTVQRIDDRGNLLLYVDRQVLNEYTSPQAFSALREARRRVWRPKNSLAVVDHVNPTAPVRTLAIADSAKAKQVSYLGENCREFGIELFDVLDALALVEDVEEVDAELAAVLPEVAHLPRLRGVGDGERADRGRRIHVVDHGERVLRPPDATAGLAQCGEGLRARVLVQHLPIDVQEKVAAIVDALHGMCVDDFAVQHACLCHGVE